MTGHVLIENPADYPNVRIVRMNRPEKKNAITRDMYGAMALALADADTDPDVRAVVLMGGSGCFSAGNDIGDFLEIAADEAEARNVTAFLHELARFSKPLLSAVDGIAIGIGVTMNFHCDLTFATPRTVFRTPFTDLALVPEAASSLLGPRIMGPHRAFALLVGGLPLSAEDARHAGFVHAIHSEMEIEAATLQAAADLARKPPEALTLSRKLIRGDIGDVVARIDEEMRLFHERLKSEEALDVLKRFLTRKS